MRSNNGMCEEEFNRQNKYFILPHCSQFLSHIYNLRRNGTDEIIDYRFIVVKMSECFNLVGNNTGRCHNTSRRNVILTHNIKNVLGNFSITSYFDIDYILLQEVKTLKTKEISLFDTCHDSFSFIFLWKLCFSTAPEL